MTFLPGSCEVFYELLLRVLSASRPVHQCTRACVRLRTVMAVALVRLRQDTDDALGMRLATELTSWTLPAGCTERSCLHDVSANTCQQLRNALMTFGLTLRSFRTSAEVRNSSHCCCTLSN